MLSRGQVQAFIPLQISALESKQIKALGSGEGNASLQDLSHEQLRAFLRNPSSKELKNLSPRQQFNALSPEQLKFIRYQYDRPHFLSYTLIYNIYKHLLVKHREQIGPHSSTNEIANVRMEVLQDLGELEIRELFFFCSFVHNGSNQCNRSKIYKIFLVLAFTFGSANSSFSKRSN